MIVATPTPTPTQTTHSEIVYEWAQLLERVQLVGMEWHLPHFSGWSTTSDKQCEKTLFLLEKTKTLLLLVAKQPELFYLESPQAEAINAVVVDAETAWFRLDEYSLHNDEMTPISLKLRESVEQTLLDFLRSLDYIVDAFLYEEKFLREVFGK